VTAPRLVRPHEHEVVPWRNRGGTTRDIARWPADTSEEAVWRLSLASIERDGPFSDFSGFDRVILLADGAGFVLEGGGRPAVALRPPPEPFSFPGEWVPECRLIGGPVRTLNVITARGQATARMTVLTLAPGEPRAVEPANVALCYVLRGAVTVAVAGCAPLAAEPGDTVVLHDTAARIVAGGAGEGAALAVVTIAVDAR
jgi:environmental stress-induced protein Ves